MHKPGVVPRRVEAARLLEHHTAGDAGISAS
jgi:hypothetical protein